MDEPGSLGADQTEGRQPRDRSRGALERLRRTLGDIEGSRPRQSKQTTGPPPRFMLSHSASTVSPRVPFEWRLLSPSFSPATMRETQVSLGSGTEISLAGGPGNGHTGG